MNAAQIIEVLLLEHKFSCVMAPLGDNVQDTIYEWGLREIPDRDLYIDPEDDDKGRQANEEIHTTVIYGLTEEVPSQKLKDILAHHSPIEGKLLPVSIFRNDGFDVIKLGVVSSDLNELHQQIKDEIGAPGDSHPVYQAHATIAYVKPGRGDHLEGATPWDAEHKLGVTFIEKHGKFKIGEVIFSGSGDQKFTLPLRKI